MAKIALLFPGQGAQYIGMGQELAEQYSEAKAIFREADDALGFPLGRLCFEGPEEELMLTINTQPAVVAVSLACLAAFRGRAQVPTTAVAGLSLGEYSALVAAGSISCGTAVALVRKRGEFMQEVIPPGKGAMIAVIGLARREVVEVCRLAGTHGVVEPANYNCPGQIVLTGETAAVEKAAELARFAGARRVVRLPVSAPFHSRLLIPAARKMAQELMTIDINDAAVPIVANVNANYLTMKEDIKKALVKQVSNPVLWEETLSRLHRDGINIYIEIGPGRSLAGFVRRTIPGATILNIYNSLSLAKTLDYLGEVV
ncbi:MAG: ACP S-malonyltransferase [Firmicutes bacterium]|nr:ACP S-malonyltransferase [Bacillota bacterium]